MTFLLAALGAALVAAAILTRQPELAVTATMLLLAEPVRRSRRP